MQSRGITLNYTASQLVNFDVNKNTISNGNETDIVTSHKDRKIKRKRAGGRIHMVTEPEDKMYGVSFLREGA
jgi:hypothetical protein